MTQSITSFYGTLVGLTASKKAVRISDITDEPNTEQWVFNKDTYWPLSMIRISVINKDKKYFKFEVPSWIWDNKVEEEGIKQFEGMSVNQFAQLGLLFADDNNNEVSKQIMDRNDEGLDF